MNDKKLVTTEETTSAAGPADDGGGRPRSNHALPVWIALLALGLGIGLAVSTYFIWHQIQRLAADQAGIEMGVSDRIRPLSSSLEGVNESLRDERSQTESRIAAVASRIDKLHADQQSIGHRLNVLAALMGRSERGWTLAEVEYLLRIANQRLQLQRDRHTATQALQAADGRLRDLADPHYLPVREQIAIELNALAAVAEVDRAGLSAKLAAALDSVDKLAVAGSEYKPKLPDVTGDTQTGKSAGTLDELISVVWGALSELFRLREHDQPVGPMLPPEREYFLRENLRLQLGAARLALLRDDQDQYHTTLLTADDWLAAYFAADNSAVRQLREDLQAMSAVDIAPALPDVSASLKLLRQQVQLSEQQEVLPVVPATVPDDEPAPTGEESVNPGGATS